MVTTIYSQQFERGGGIQGMAASEVCSHLGCSMWWALHTSIEQLDSVNSLSAGVMAVTCNQRGDGARRSVVVTVIVSILVAEATGVKASGWRTANPNIPRLNSMGTNAPSSPRTWDLNLAGR